jgi:transposase InsO family protein
MLARPRWPTQSNRGRGPSTDRRTPGRGYAAAVGGGLKYEEVYLNAYASVAEAKAGIGAWLNFYNEERQHQSLGYRTPANLR